ncbi:MAG: glutathione S-transferase C-terminal domain-containing protein [Rhodobacteraceae bacterium]|nr:glutathione S-transferase C-terminal domain-containing protein [Paracoccaceae bacterium]
MADLSQFPITKRWPAEHPDRIQLYSLPTPNGIKVSAALEELGLPYEAHLVSFATDDQMTPEFISLSPNNKIPAILDPNGPDGEPIAVFESGAILLYLAEKTGKLMPSDPRAKSEVTQWLMFQMGGVGPMLGQLGFFHKFAGGTFEDKRPLDRYVNEATRLFEVMEARLTDREYFVGNEYTIADLALWPWVRTVDGYYDAGELIGTDDFPKLREWYKRCEARPASQIGIKTPARN